jgi:hypothetical protein
MNIDMVRLFCFAIIIFNKNGTIKMVENCGRRIDSASLQAAGRAAPDVRYPKDFCRFFQALHSYLNNAIRDSPATT